MLWTSNWKWIIRYISIQSKIIHIDKVNLHLPRTFLFLYSWASQSDNNAAKSVRLTHVQQHTPWSLTKWGLGSIRRPYPTLDEERWFLIDPQSKEKYFITTTKHDSRGTLNHQIVTLTRTENIQEQYCTY